MALPIEDYGIIGDLPHRRPWSAGTGRSTGCACPASTPAACFAKLLGDRGPRLAGGSRPKGPARATHRHYRGDTLVLESEFVTDEGTVRIIDCMPIRAASTPRWSGWSRGSGARSPWRCDLTIRFGYGQVVPWVRQHRRRRSTPIAGPDALSLWTPVPTHGADLSTVAEFTVAEGQTRAVLADLVPGQRGAAPAGRRPLRHRATPSSGGRSGCASAPTRASTARRWSAR